MLCRDINDTRRPTSGIRYALNRFSVVASAGFKSTSLSRTRLHAASLKRVYELGPRDTGGKVVATSPSTERTRVEGRMAQPAEASRLAPPPGDKIPVAFLITEGVTVIDFAGPWEVFQDVHVPSRGPTLSMPFQLYTVSDTTAPLTASAGLKIIPDYAFEAAPDPRVVVVPAQGGRSEALREWLVDVAETADVTMSVCTGAFVLAWAGLLSGKEATTHHDFLDRFAAQYPDIDIKRGHRFVEGPRISTAGGLTSGIDMALRVVERYFGRTVAQATATYMEYDSTGWMR